MGYEGKWIKPCCFRLALEDIGGWDVEYVRSDEATFNPPPDRKKN